MINTQLNFLDLLVLLLRLAILPWLGPVAKRHFDVVVTITLILTKHDGAGIDMHLLIHNAAVNGPL